MYTTFLLFFFEIQSLFKVSLLCFNGWPLSFVKGEFKDLSKFDGTSLMEWPNRSCLVLYVSARVH